MANRQVGVNGKKFLLLSTQYYNDLLRRAKLSDSTQLRKTLDLDEQREQIANQKTSEKPPYRKRKYLEKTTADFLREKDRAVDLAPKHHGYVKKGRVGVIVDRGDHNVSNLESPKTPPPLVVPPRTNISPASVPSSIHRPQSSVNSVNLDESYYHDPFNTMDQTLEPDQTEAASSISEPPTRLVPASLEATVPASSTSTTSSPTEAKSKRPGRPPVNQPEATEDPSKPKFSSFNIIQRIKKDKALGIAKSKSLATLLSLAKGDDKITDWDEKTGKLIHQPGNIENIIGTLYGKNSKAPEWAQGTDLFLDEMAADPRYKYLKMGDVPNLHAWKHYQSQSGFTSTTRKANTVGKGNGPSRKKTVRWKGLS